MGKYLLRTLLSWAVGRKMVMYLKMGAGRVYDPDASYLNMPQRMLRK